LASQPIRQSTLKWLIRPCSPLIIEKIATASAE